MLKRFFVSFAGSLTAIFISGFLFFAIILMAIMGVAMSSHEVEELKNKSILKLNLSGTIDERVVAGELIDEISAFDSKAKNQGLNDITKAIRAAAKDKKISGLFINCEGSSAGIATRCEIIKAIDDFKKSGKWVCAYGDNIDQGDYLIASTADKIYLNPEGLVNITGLSATVMFFKNLLDKIGVEAQVIKVGTYKSAVEPYLLDQMSEPSRLQTEEYVNGIWNTLTPIISKNREVSEQDVNMWADSLCVTWSTAQLVKNKIIDATFYHHQMEEKLVALSGVDEVDDLNFISPAGYLSKANIDDGGDDEIAVLYAVGDIVDTGKSGISAEIMVPQILKLAEEDDVKGLVLRVNSGGGSAFASEQIWEALEQFKAKGKSFYVAMGDVAASGGYYISCGADSIFASPQTLTGSIGIFGIIPSFKGLLNDKLGVTTSVVNSNANGNFLNIDNPMTPFQRQAMQNRIDRGYETFVKRCANGRGMTVDQIKAIAEGRVWSGVKAKEIGLVDGFADLNQAVMTMAGKLGLDDYSVVEYPSAKNDIWEQVFSAQASMETELLQKYLGENYKLYTTLRDIKNLSPIQCRAELIELK